MGKKESSDTLKGVDLKTTYQDLPGLKKFGQLASLETALAKRQNGQFNYIGVCALISQLMGLRIAWRRIIQ